MIACWDFWNVQIIFSKEEEDDNEQKETLGQEEKGRRRRIKEGEKGKQKS